MQDARFTIQLAAKLSGLSTHVIRIWEQRYQILSPQRSQGGHRLYTHTDIEKLKLLSELTREGHSIGQLAGLSMEALAALPQNESQESKTTRASATHFTPRASQLLRECLDAVRALDSQSLRHLLERAELELGSQGLLLHLLAPLSQKLGDLWRQGELLAAHEHFASAQIKAVLMDLSRPYASREEAPVLVVATPAGQLHEIGALLAGALAANLGWSVTQLGAGLPAAEIAAAAHQTRARAVALSIVYPEDDDKLPAELARLRAALPRNTRLIAGGRAASAYGRSLKEQDALILENLRELGEALDRLRTERD